MVTQFQLLALCLVMSFLLVPHVRLHGQQTPLPGITSKETTLPFLSTTILGNSIYASTEHGIYRADLDERRWHTIPLPAADTSGGRFGVTPEKKGDLWYVVRIEDKDPNNLAHYRTLVYRLPEGAERWELATDQHLIGYVFVHPNGTLFAIRREYTRKVLPGKGDKPVITMRDRITISTDLGKTWTDITGDIGGGVELLGIAVDPDRPEQVRLYGNCLRPYTLDAPEGYDRWRMTRAGWNPTPETDERFFRQGYSVMSIGYVLNATLANYFQYPFENRTSLPAFTLTTDRTAYAFAPGAPRTVLVTVGFIAKAKDPVRLIDRQGDAGFWALKMKTPVGEYRYIESAIWTALQPEKDREGAAAKQRLSPNIIAVEMNTHQPYTRTIDLSQLDAFTAKGTYTVQLIYTNPGIGDRKQGEWWGSFTGEIFTVKIE